MFTLNNFALLALAGTTLAAPQWQGGWGNWQGGWQHGNGNGAPAAPESTSTVWDIQTATVTMTGTAPTWAPEAPAPTPEASAAPSPSPSPAAFYSAPAAPSGSWGNAPSSAAPAAPAASSGWSSSGSTGTYMDVVNKWRSAGGLPQLSESDQLQGNAMKTVQDSNGQMVHELNPGSMGQVLAPGNADNFESVYVGGWLCEVPSLPGLNGICSTMAQGWDHSDGETGHADILTSTGYTKIGCALYAGIWACDLA